MLSSVSWRHPDKTSVTRLHLSVVPGSRQNRIELTANGLQVHVAAPAREGKANKQLLLLLADRLQVPVSHINLMRGAGSRYKVIEVLGLSDQQVESRLLR